MRRAFSLAFLVLLSGVLIPAGVQAQLLFSVSPVLGAGNFPDAYDGAPERVSGNRIVNVDAVAALGIQGELAYGELPVRLRVGGIRTVGGSLRAHSGFRTSSCGARCTRSEALYDSVGDAAVSFVWTDVVFAPFSWTISPYLHGGFAYRRVSVSAEDAQLASYLGEARSHVLGRMGAGLEIEVFEASAVWIEASWYGAEERAPYSDEGSRGWAPVSRQNLAAVGIRFPLFR